MVRLDRIYTGGGDSGETSLGDGARAPKHHPRLAAIGDVDEANAVVGLARAGLGAAAARFDATLSVVQNDLFDVGADLSVPEDRTGRPRLRLDAARAAWLERRIDAVNEALAPLSSFVLPGGSEAAARLHLARTAVRRAERTVAALAAAETLNPALLVYLNRLSDLLFVMARAANDDGAGDVPWRPGGGAAGA